LERFYTSLNDEQRARFNALVEQQRQSSRRARPAGEPSVAADCGIARPGVMAWPEVEIEQRVHPTDAQRPALASLRDAAAKAEDMLKSCEPNNALTLQARLAAISDRLNTMLDAVKTVHAALDKFYALLTDEQKSAFETIGRVRAG
jgi:LTXXQ motif family protein